MVTTSKCYSCRQMRWHICLLFVSAVGCLSNCSGVTDLKDNEPCKNVGYSIASRTLDCTSDPALANARYESFHRATRCQAAQGGEADFECAISLNEATCAEVETYGDDIDLWLARTDTCAAILLHADGSELGGTNVP